MVVALAAASTLPSNAQETQFLDASPFALGPTPNPQHQREKNPPPQGFAVGFTHSGGALGPPSHVGHLPLNPRPNFDNPEFEGEEREESSSKYPEGEEALNPGDLTSTFNPQPDFDGHEFEAKEDEEGASSTFHEGEERISDYGGETEYTDTTGGFLTSPDFTDRPDALTPAPSSPREEQHQPPPSSKAPALHNLPQVPDVTPQQDEEELQLQPPSRGHNRDNADETDHHTQTFDPLHQFPEVPEGRQQLSTQSHFEETQDVVEVVSAPRPPRSPEPARPRPYPEIPYRRTVHPNQLPAVSEIQIAAGVNEGGDR